MFCNNCGTQYDVVSIEIGKSKFCRSCGNVLYKNENGNVVFNDVAQAQNNADLERQQQEILLKKRQLEIEQKQKIELEKQKQEEVLREQKNESERKRQEEIFEQRQLEIKKNQELEAEKLKQAEIIKQRQLEIQRQNEEIERVRLSKIEEERKLEKLEKLKQIESEKLRQIEIEKQKEIAIEKEFADKEKNRIALEKAAQELKEEEKNENKETEKEIVTTNTNDESVTKTAEEIKEKSTKKNKLFYLIIPIVLIVVSAILSCIIFPEKIKTFFQSSAILKDNTTIETPVNTDVLNSNIDLIESLKSVLIGKEILSWNAIKTKEIKKLVIKSFSEMDKNSSYIVDVNLENNTGTKATTELVMNFDNIVLKNVEINNITYKNIAPVNAWFSFNPIPNCEIVINTNNNPIQLKTCENCAVQKINTNTDTQKTLETHPEKIFISADNNSESVVNFTYIPIK